MTAPFQEAKVRRGPGGLFAAKAAAGGKPTGAWAAGPIRNGTGRKGAPDARVKALQKQLNALGVTDERGRPLLLDGISGAHTTAAVKKFQKANGLAPTGVVDAALMVKILTAKPAAKKAAAKPAARSAAKTTRSTTPSGRPPARKPVAATKPAKKTARDMMATNRGQARLGSGAGT